MTTPVKLPTSPDLFRPEPPVLPDVVKQSFCGREKELRLCVETLIDNLDIDARRSKSADKWPWIIHGESRCGKSHLARRILLDLPQKDSHVQIEVPAREQVSALKVMGTVFRKFVALFYARINDQRRSDPIDRPNEITVITSLIERTERFLDDAENQTESTELTTESAVEAGGEIGGFLGKLVSKVQTKAGDKSGRQIVIRPPTAFRLAELCRVLAEALFQRKLVRHILVLVDDVDLLETYQSSTRNSQLQRSELADALTELHSEPAVDVVLTARSWYAYTTKDFHPLIDLTQTQLGVEELVRIHNRRLELYAAGFVGFLTPEAVREVAGEMSGLPGVFLNHLQSVYHHFRLAGDPTLRDYRWFLDVLRNQFTALKAKCAPAVAALETAIKANQFEIMVSESNPFYSTAFDNQFVFQSYYNEKCYFMAPIMRRILQEEVTLSLELRGSGT